MLALEEKWDCGAKLRVGAKFLHLLEITREYRRALLLGDDCRAVVSMPVNEIATSSEIIASNAVAISNE